MGSVIDYTQAHSKTKHSSKVKKNVKGVFKKITTYFILLFFAKYISSLVVGTACTVQVCNHYM